MPAPEKNRRRGGNGVETLVVFVTWRQSYHYGTDFKGTARQIEKLISERCITFFFSVYFFHFSNIRTELHTACTEYIPLSISLAKVLHCGRVEAYKYVAGRAGPADLALV